MAGAIKVGSVCIKTTGRKAGAKVTVVSMERGFAIIEGKGVKKKKSNIRHLIPVEKEKHGKHAKEEK